MKLVRLIHLLIALLFPALSAIMVGFLAWLFGCSLKSRVNLMIKVLASLGLPLAGVKLHCNYPNPKGHKPSATQLHKRPAVYIFNHQSGLDPVIICTLLQHEVVGIAKPALAKNLVLGPLLKLTGTLFFDQGKAGKGFLSRDQLINTAVQRLDQGFAIAIAPEGTRINALQNKIGKFRLGAFEIAQRSGCPIIPIVIHNSGECLAPKSAQLKPGVVEISLLPERMVPPQQDLAEAALQMEQQYESCLAASY